MSNAIIRHLTEVLLFAGIAMLVPAAYALWAGEKTVAALLLPAAIMILPGLPRLAKNTHAFAHTSLADAWRRIKGRPVESRPWNFAYSLLTLEFVKHRDETALSSYQAIVVSALAWIIVPAICMIPYLALGYSPADSAFESMSGWTTTGLSTIPFPENLPSSIVFYRSFMQWIGGVGIIIFALIVMRAPAASELFRAEGHEGIEFGIRKTVNRIWLIYLLLSIVGAALLCAAGMTLFYSVNITMATISTGGFLPSSDTAFSLFQKIGMIAIMIAGATSFAMHSEILQRKWASVMRNTEFKLMLAVIALFSSAVFFTGVRPENALFFATAATSTAGLTIENLGLLGDLAKYLLVLLMIAGGTSGSTAGGVRMWRIALLFKSLRAKIRAQFLPPGAVQPIKVNGRVMTQDQLAESGSFIFLYSAVVLAGSAALMATDMKSMDAFFSVASAMGNVGLATLDMGALPQAGKWLLTLVMYIGRIEILPGLVLIKFLKDGGR
ncbi:MAG: potassium transporter TrkG [Candidatus Micrarchaeota archaeon]